MDSGTARTDRKLGQYSRASGHHRRHSRGRGGRPHARSQTSSKHYTFCGRLRRFCLDCMVDVRTLRAIDDIVGFVLLVSSVFLNQTKALHALTLNLKSQNTEIECQHKLLEQQSAQLAEWNRTLS